MVRQGRQLTFLTMHVAALSTSIATTTSAQSSSVLYDALDMKLSKSQDAMTDGVTCLLRIGPESWKFTIDSDKSFLIEKTVGQIAPDEQHMIRLGRGKPIPLTYVPRRNLLTLRDPISAGAIVKAIVQGSDSVRIRFFTFPSREIWDVTVENPNVGLAYQRGVAGCGWRPLIVPAVIASARISVYEPADANMPGYASVRVVGNSNLSLTKGFDTFGGGCQIKVGPEEFFGIKEGQWTGLSAVAAGRGEYVVRDSAGKELLKTASPEAAARSAWSAGPLATLERSPSWSESSLTRLYGFRELWEWGVRRCRFPSIE
jgi:hypothetical protein